MTEELYELCDKLMKDIKELNKKDDISPTELDKVYKAVDIIKDIKTIEAREDAGYSNMYPYSYDDGMMHMNSGGRYSYDNSYRRGRDSMGRYTSRDDGYNRGGDDREHLMRQIDMLRTKVDQM